METKSFLEKLEHHRIVEAIAAAEAKTSGEIRVFIQHGKVDDPVAEAQAQFETLGMTATRERNAVLVFVAPRAQKFAVIGDEGIHRRCGLEFWQMLVEKMGEQFRTEHFTEALVRAIGEAGDQLAQHFPIQPDDRDELPNTIEEG
ncbi:MAG: TPM domain-containing protein [Verrucomicrobiota bacterium]|nr:TPM domain-containing protein [Verrucomicrobiota bacterium]